MNLAIGLAITNTTGLPFSLTCEKADLPGGTSSIIFNFLCLALVIEWTPA